LPVRSLTSPVFRWPDGKTVADAVVAWARAEAARHQGVVAIGYFGSYAKGTWSVGSDVDLVAVVSRAEAPFESRSVDWDTTALPVPAQLLVYTIPEWRHVVGREDRFARVLLDDVIWAFGQPPAHTERLAGP